MIGTKHQILSFLQDKDDSKLYELKEFVGNRTNSQNALYWKYLEDLTSAFLDKGIFITSDILHEGLKVRLIPGKYVINPITGQRITQRKSTTKLNKKEFSKYIKDIEQYIWQTYEISVPLATDYFYNKEIFIT